MAFPLVVTKPFPRHVMITIFLYAMLAQAWNLLAGYCGQISLGHAVFFGTGAYTSTLLLKYLNLTPWGGMLAGVVVAVRPLAVHRLPGVQAARPLLRHRHHRGGRDHRHPHDQLGLGGGARGLFVPIKRPDSWLNFQFHESKQNYYYIALALLVLALWITLRVERSRLGYYLRAIREDQDAAASLGIPVAAYKQRAMALSAGLTALGDLLRPVHSLHRPGVGVPDGAQHPHLPRGRARRGGHAVGPLVGAAILIPLGEWTRISFGGSGKAVDLLVYGALIMIVSVVQPGGIMALAGRGRRRTG